MMSIVVLGTVAMDTVKTPFGRRARILGGSAVHFAMSARIFTTVHLVAIVGRDFPQRYIDFLKKKGIVLSSLIRASGKTFEWEGEYKGDLNTAITLNTELGVLTSFRPVIQEEQRKIKYLFLANVDPDIQRRLLEKMKPPRLVGLDSMNFWIRHKRNSLLRLFKKVDIYVANDQEARSLTGEHNLVKAAGYLAKQGPKIILIKKGEHGVILYSKEFIHSRPENLALQGKDEKCPLSISLSETTGFSPQSFIFSIPAYPTHKVIDPTGAGDTFAGGFMGYLARAGKITPLNLRKAIAYGTVVASFNVEDFGLNKTSRLRRQDLERRLAQFRKCTLF